MTEAAHPDESSVAATPVRARRPSRSTVNRPAAIVAAASGIGAVVAAYLTWFRIEIDGLVAPGSLESGWEGRDGRTIALVGAGAVVVAALLAVGRTTAWLKGALLVGGGVATIIAVVNLVDARGKAARIEEEFGVPAASVSAQAGVGLWLLAAMSLGLLAAGFLTKRSSRAR